MAKKKSSSKKASPELNVFENLGKSILQMIFQTVIDDIKARIMSTVEDIGKAFSKSITKAGTFVGHFFAIITIVLVGFFMLMASFILLTAEFFKVSMGVSLLIWSTVILIVGLLYAIKLAKANEVMEE